MECDFILAVKLASIFFFFVNVSVAVIVEQHASVIEVLLAAKHGTFVTL
jgi:hypothetical protein